MPKKSLIDTNPYLRDPQKFREGLVRNVSSSTAVETGAKVESVARTLLASGKSIALNGRR